MWNPLHTISSFLPSPAPHEFENFDPPELDEGSPVIIHGNLADYNGVITEILNDRRCRVRWYCDVRRWWFESAVDIDRCEWFNWQVLQ